MVFCSAIICLPFTLNLLSFLFLRVTVLNPVQRGVSSRGWDEDVGWRGRLSPPDLFSVGS